MRTLDRYVIRSFLINVVLAMVVLLALRTVVDLFINMDEFAKLGLPFQELMAHIWRYYSYQMLVYFLELGGLGLVFAAAFTLAHMNHSNELTAILASGVSLHRVVWPILVSAILLSGLVVIDQELIIPRVADKLVRTRDDVPGTQQFPILLATDSGGTVFYATLFKPEQGVMSNPFLHVRDIRDEQNKPLATVSGHHATPGTLDGQSGWFVHQAVLLRTLSGEKAWENMPDWLRVYTYVGPVQMIQAAQDENRQRGTSLPMDVDIAYPLARTKDPQYDLTVEAERFAYTRNAETGGIDQASLTRPRFTFHSPEGVLLGSFVADQARWVGQTPSYWELTNGRFFRPSDLDTRYLVLRQSGRWLSLMSTQQIAELLKLKRLADARPAVLTFHARIADPINNIIMLLMALPFILSRERKIKASAGWCLLAVGVFYVFVYVCRYVGLPPEWAAWLPILVFGPLAMVLMDAVKT